jgi:hypothetical protein
VRQLHTPQLRSVRSTNASSAVPSSSAVRCKMSSCERPISCSAAPSSVCAAGFTNVIFPVASRPKIPSSAHARMVSALCSASACRVIARLRARSLASNTAAMRSDSPLTTNTTTERETEASPAAQIAGFPRWLTAIQIASHATTSTIAPVMGKNARNKRARTALPTSADAGHTSPPAAAMVPAPSTTKANPVGNASGITKPSP